MATWYLASDKWTAVTPWAALTLYAVGDIRRQLATPTVGNERVWRCTTLGTSGAAEPSWTLTKGSTTSDGTAVWTEITGSSTYNTSPASMLAPHARIESVAAWMAAGDTLYIGNHHAQPNAAGTQTTTFPGTLSSPNYIYVVDDTNATATLASGATVTTVSFQQFMQGSFYIESSSTGGLVFQCSTTMTLANTPTAKQVYKNVDFIISASTSLTLGGVTGASSGLEFYGCRLKFGGAAAGLICNGKIRFYNMSFISGSTAVTNLVKSSGSGLAYDVIFDGCDLLNMGTASNLVIGGSSSQIGSVIFQGCKLPASWSGLLLSTDYTTAGPRVEFHACDTADVMFNEAIQDYTGKIVQETATYTRTAGASVPNSKSGGTTPQLISWKLTPTSSCLYPINVLKTSSIAVMDLITGDALPGAQLTLTAHALCDQVAAVTNAVFWMEVSYPGTAGSTLYTVATNSPTTALTTATSLGTGSGWTTSGMTNPQQVISVLTFTPQEIGVIMVRLCVGSATPATIYVDPKIV